MKRGLSIIAILFFSVIVFGIGNPAQGAEVKPIELRIMHWGSTALFVHKDVFVPWIYGLREAYAKEFMSCVAIGNGMFR